MKKFLIFIMFISTTTNIFSQNDDIKNVYYAFLQNKGKCNSTIINYILKESSVNGSASYNFIKNLYPNIDSTTINNFKASEKINLSFNELKSIIELRI